LITSADSAFIGFHEDRLGGSPATIDWSQIPVGIPVEKPLLRWIGFDCGNRYALGIAAFLIRFGLDYYSLTKVFKGKPFISRPISSLLTLRKNGAFSFSTPLCTIRPYTARPSCKTLLSMKSAQRTKPQHRCFNHATIQHPVLVQPRNLALPESDSPKSEFIADSEALLKISDKSVSNHAFKNNSARKLRCLIQSFYQSLIKKTIIMLNKKTIKNRIYGNTRL
jgi:hypothetical protein